jgi:hypothetical protein
LPLVAPASTGTMLVALHVVGVAVTPSNAIVLVLVARSLNQR